MIGDGGDDEVVRRAVMMNMALRVFSNVCLLFPPSP